MWTLKSLKTYPSRPRIRGVGIIHSGIYFLGIGQSAVRRRYVDAVQYRCPGAGVTRKSSISSTSVLCQIGFRVRSLAETHAQRADIPRSYHIGPGFTASTIIATCNKQHLITHLDSIYSSWKLPLYRPLPWSIASHIFLVHYRVARRM